MNERNNEEEHKETALDALIRNEREAKQEVDKLDEKVGKENDAWKAAIKEKADKEVVTALKESLGKLEQRLKEKEAHRANLLAQQSVRVTNSVCPGELFSVSSRP
jgi:YesN/AraC family two-component response regulator